MKQITVSDIFRGLSIVDLEKKECVFEEAAQNNVNDEQLQPHPFMCTLAGKQMLEQAMDE